MPVTAGPYELRFFRNNTYTVLVTSATITAGPLEHRSQRDDGGAGRGGDGDDRRTGRGNLTDWVGLFATPPAADERRGLASIEREPHAPTSGLMGSDELMFMLPVTAGTFDPRVFSGQVPRLGADDEALRLHASLLSIALSVIDGGAGRGGDADPSQRLEPDGLAGPVRDRRPADELPVMDVSERRSHLSPRHGAERNDADVHVAVMGTYQRRFFFWNKTNMVLVMSATITGRSAQHRRST